MYKIGDKVRVLPNKKTGYITSIDSGFYYLDNINRPYINEQLELVTEPFKLGDKVEYLNNVWEVSSVETNTDGTVSVEVYNDKLGIDIYVSDDELTPYRTAHEKLIEMGYELTKRTDYVFYRHDDLPRITIYSDKTYSCSDTNLELSRILTQYLEEMEE